MTVLTSVLTSVSKSQLYDEVWWLASCSEFCAVLKHWQWMIDWLRFYITFDTKYVIFETLFHKPISWLGMEKLNLAQQKYTFTNQKKCTTTQNKHKKTKARFSRLLRHLAWKWRGPSLVLALHKFVAYLLTYLLRHLPTYLQPRDPHGTRKQVWQPQTQDPLTQNFFIRRRKY